MKKSKKTRVLKAAQVKRLDPGTKVTEKWMIGPTEFNHTWTVIQEGKHKKLCRDTGTEFLKQKIEDKAGHWYEV